MSNIILFDESKCSDQSLLIFTGLVFSNKEYLLQFENYLKLIKLQIEKKYNIEFKEIHASSFKKKISKVKVELFNSFVSLFFQFHSVNLVNLRFYIMHKLDLKLEDVDFTEVINGIIKNTTDLEKNEIKNLLYYQLSTLLIKRIDELPLINCYIEAVISDNIFNLEKSGKQAFWAFGNIFKQKDHAMTFIPQIIEILHNKIKPTHNHVGFKYLDFIDSHHFITLQFVDVLSNFILSHIRYTFLLQTGNAKYVEYESKYNLLKKIIDLSQLPIKDLNLEYDTESKDIKSTKIFDAILGKS